MAEELKRKFQNITPGWIGASVRDGEGKWTSMPVEPGGFIWLSEEEERKTAEAPRNAADNPFTKGWQRPTKFNTDNEPIEFETVTGQLVLIDHEPRPIASERYTPSAADRSGEEPPKAPEAAPTEEEQVGSPDAPPPPSQPPEEGRPAPDEVVGSPDAAAANDAERRRRAQEQAAAGARPLPDAEPPPPIGGLPAAARAEE